MRRGVAASLARGDGSANHALGAPGLSSLDPVVHLGRPAPRRRAEVAFVGRGPGQRARLPLGDVHSYQKAARRGRAARRLHRADFRTRAAAVFPEGDERNLARMRDVPRTGIAWFGVTGQAPAAHGFVGPDAAPEEGASKRALRGALRRQVHALQRDSNASVSRVVPLEV